MWTISQVERLTGMPRRQIQQLCHQNEKTGGIAFWAPVEQSPGHAYYDEMDLLVFYLVRQFRSAGFKLKDMERAFESALDSPETFSPLLDAKQSELQNERRETTAKLSELKRLRSAGTKDTDRLSANERLISIIREHAEGNIHHAIDETGTELGYGRAQRLSLQTWFDSTLSSCTGCRPFVWRSTSYDSDASISPIIASVKRLQRAHRESEAADSAKSQDALRGLLQLLPSEAGGPSFAASALQHVLTEPGMGALVEIICGKGFFDFLARSVECFLGSKHPASTNESPSGKEEG